MSLHYLALGGSPIVDQCANLARLSTSPWVQRDVRRTGRRGCSCACECADPVPPAPWVNPARPASLEGAAITVAEFEPSTEWLTSSGGGADSLSDVTCGVLTWRLLLDLWGSLRGIAEIKTWLLGQIGASGCWTDCNGCGSCAACGRCAVVDSAVQVSCDAPLTLRGLRVAVARSVETRDGLDCHEQLELLIEAQDPRLFTEWFTVASAEPDDLANICNPAHPWFSALLDYCDATCPPGCPESPRVEWPADSTRLGCPLAVDGDGVPVVSLAQSIRVPQTSAQWNLLDAIPGLSAPITVAVVATPGAGHSVLPSPDGATWNVDTTGPVAIPGAYTAELLVTDTTGAECQVALGLLVLPCNTTSQTDPPVDPCEPLQCYDREEADQYVATLTSGGEVVGWTPPFPLAVATVVSGPTFGTVTTVGTGIRWDPAPDEAGPWSDAVTLSWGACFGVVVLHYAPTVERVDPPCNAIVVAPTIVPEVPCDTDPCEPLRVLKWCATMPADPMGYVTRFTIEGPLLGTLRNLRVTWWSCGEDCPPKCVDHDGQLNVRRLPAGSALVVTDLGAVIVDADGCESTLGISGERSAPTVTCGDVCVCIVVESPGDDTDYWPQSITLEGRRWVL